jgi:glycosyltransferase involved in cell wall biosynthesis
VEHESPTASGNMTKEEGRSATNVQLGLSCLLVTAARNEEAFIEKTIQSVVSQTVRPRRWVIVNDGSTDGTATIARRYAALHDWIDVIDMPEHRDRSFAAKAHCFAAGYATVKTIDHEIVGNVDADVSFGRDHLEFLLRRFEEDPALGVVGTVFKESDGYSSETDSFEGHTHVAGPCQLFRRRCFEDIGGYVPNKAGGVDWMAVITARMKGWKTRSFRERWFFHHRSLGTAGRGTLASRFVYGERDYYIGGHPLWEFCRVGYQMSKRPYLLGGLAIGLGYGWAALRRTKRPVSDEFVRFHRNEQLQKLRAIVRSRVTFKRIDSFRVTPDTVDRRRR